jgi:hypothetical protein
VETLARTTRAMLRPANDTTASWCRDSSSRDGDPRIQMALVPPPAMTGNATHASADVECCETFNRIPTPMRLISSDDPPR